MKLYLFEDKRILKSSKLNEFDFIDHVFSTRDFGNQGLHINDDRNHVLNNRKNLAKTIKVDYHNVIAAKQVHGSNSRCVYIDDIGKGALYYNESLDNCDALITNIPNLPLFAFYADCVPIFLVDPIKKCIGIVHSGWKGTLNNIIGNTIDNIILKFDSSPADIIAIIGPYIKGSCYEVSNEIIEQFTKLGYNKENQIIGNNIDLGLIIQHQLYNKGIYKIEIDDYCTSCNLDLFFSHRKEHGHSGRMAGIIMLKGE